MDQNDTVEKIKSCCLKHIEAVPPPTPPAPLAASRLLSFLPSTYMLF
jgi:hypothetical protein